MRYLLPKLAGTAEYRLEDLCASFQEAVVDVLVSKTIAATKSAGRTMVALSGGVSCNSRLRERMAQACVRNGLKLLVADPALCTDNAAMIAFVALQKMKNKSYSLLSADIDPNLQLV